MQEGTNRRATYEDLVALPDHVIGEIIAGEFVVSPRPAAPHARSASAMGIDLGGPFDRGHGSGPGGWWLLYEPELHFGTDVLVPDLAGWRRERMPVIPDVAFFTLAPDWIAEVVSPGSARRDRMRKLPIYARERVAHLWLVDPSQRTIESYELAGEHWVLLGTFGGAAKTARIEPFTAVELEIEGWWLGESPGP